MIHDRLQYFLDDFWNFEHFVKIWTRRPSNYYQNASTSTQKYGDIKEHIIFVNLGLNIFEKDKSKFRAPFLFWNLSISFYITFYEDEDRKMITIG